MTQKPISEMTQLNWQKIAAENPKAFSAFLQYRDSKDCSESTLYAIEKYRNFLDWVGYLLEFFDSNGIHIITAKSVPDENEYIIEKHHDPTNGNCSYVRKRGKPPEWAKTADSIRKFLQSFPSRQEALSEGVAYAFGLLEERLKGGEG